MCDLLELEVSIVLVGYFCFFNILVSFTIQSSLQLHILPYVWLKILDVLEMQAKMPQVHFFTWDLGDAFTNYLLHLSLFTGILSSNFSWWSGKKILIWHCFTPIACYIEFMDAVPASGLCPGFYSLHVQMHSLLLHQFICSLKYHYVSQMALSCLTCICACCKKVLMQLGLLSQWPLQGRVEEVKARSLQLFQCQRS